MDQKRNARRGLLDFGLTPDSPSLEPEIQPSASGEGNASVGTMDREFLSKASDRW